MVPLSVLALPPVTVVAASSVAVPSITTTRWSRRSPSGGAVHEDDVADVAGDAGGAVGDRGSASRATGTAGTVTRAFKRVAPASEAAWRRGARGDADGRGRTEATSESASHRSPLSIAAPGRVLARRIGGRAASAPDKKSDGAEDDATDATLARPAGTRHPGSGFPHPVRVAYGGRRPAEQYVMVCGCSSFSYVLLQIRKQAFLN
jgi:hypothetical protein